MDDAVHLVALWQALKQCDGAGGFAAVWLAFDHPQAHRYFAFSDAVSGCMDYFVVVTLHFVRGSTNVSTPLASDIQSIDYVITNVADNTEIFRQAGLSFSAKEASSSSGLKKMAQNIADSINEKVKEFKAKKSGGKR